LTSSILDSRPQSIGIVLSAGGLRGAAHLGVLRRIVRSGVPIDVMAGVSAGAILAAFYAAVGLSVQEMIDHAPTFRGRHILMHGITLRSHRLLKPYLRRFCGIIPRRLDELEAASFTTLHHGIKRLGIVCHDIERNQPRYFSTAESCGVRLSDVARASAAVPGVLPAKAMTINGQPVRLADGGLSDSLPVDFARSAQMGATHVIVSDCRFSPSSVPVAGKSLIYIRPDLDGLRPLRGPRTALTMAVSRGEAAVTREIIDQIRSWMPVAAAIA
jgi:NTE family protein